MPDYLPPIVVTSVIVMFPSALVMGAAFPIGVKLWTERGRATADETERLGVFYALNVCGAIVGSLATGFLLLPAAGSRSSLSLRRDDDSSVRPRAPGGGARAAATSAGVSAARPRCCSPSPRSR